MWKIPASANPGRLAENGVVRAIVLGTLGLLPALAAQWIALGIGGAGHGWVGPVFFSMPLFLLYPLAFLRALPSPAGAQRADAILLAAAGGLDFLLLGDMILVEKAYVLAAVGAAPGLVALWLALWAAWQVPAVAALLRNRDLQGVRRH